MSSDTSLQPQHLWQDIKCLCGQAMWHSKGLIRAAHGSHPQGSLVPPVLQITWPGSIVPYVAPQKYLRFSFQCI